MEFPHSVRIFLFSVDGWQKIWRNIFWNRSKEKSSLVRVMRGCGELPARGRFGSILIAQGGSAELGLSPTHFQHWNLHGTFLGNMNIRNLSFFFLFFFNVWSVWPLGDALSIVLARLGSRVLQGGKPTKRGIHLNPTMPAKQALSMIKWHVGLLHGNEFHLKAWVRNVSEGSDSSFWRSLSHVSCAPFQSKFMMPRAYRKKRR